MSSGMGIREKDHNQQHGTKKKKDFHVLRDGYKRKGSQSTAWHEKTNINLT